MQDVFRTNDPVALSYAQALLADAGIESLTLDVFTSVMEGSIGAIPRRLAVDDADSYAARQVLADAGLLDQNGTSNRDGTRP